ncbi:MAG: zinc metallopeptidase [Lentisphaeria bacterium]|jgi:Zn-dependent membrane protease YugP
MLLGLDPLYWMLALPGLMLSMLASFYVKTAFGQYSRVRSQRGLTGAEAAATMLRRAGVNDVRIERVGGFLSDHYDPTVRTLRLSPEVYGSESLAAIGVACHEAGHALQHADNYAWLGLRTSLVPLASFGSNFSYILFFIGLFLRSMLMVKMGLILFAAAVLFTIVTLPVEWNASARAKEAMVNSGIVTHEEREGAATVLNAAFLTYVAAAVSAILTLLYFLLRSGLLGGRRND